MLIDPRGIVIRDSQAVWRIQRTAVHPSELCFYPTRFTNSLLFMVTPGSQISRPLLVKHWLVPESIHTNRRKLIMIVVNVIILDELRLNCQHFVRMFVTIDEVAPVRASTPVI